MPNMPGLQESGIENQESKNLNVPSHESDEGELEQNQEDQKPEIINPGESNSDVKVQPAPKKGIEVVAERKGFYNQHRKREGDKFFVPSIDKCGEWMRCTDPHMEKQRKKFLKDKKLKAKQ